jgi:Tfp pilus assembly protein PilE
MGPARHIRERLANEEGGFTLVELLVVIIIAIVTTLALFAFQDLALRQSTRVFARVDATQEARQAIERIETRLHSACIKEDVTPIQGGSTTTSLNFISKFGSAASLTPELHKIALSGTSLIDSTYAYTGVDSSGKWLFSSTPSSSVKLLSNVTTAAGSTGIFSYYKYDEAKDSTQNSYLDAAGNPFYILLDGVSTLPSGLKTSGGASVPAGTLPANSTALTATPPAGLSDTDAQNTAAVGIKFFVGADGNLGTNPIADAPLTVSDTVVLRITPVPSDNNQGVPAPCE